MIKFKSIALTVLVNIFLFIWQLPQVFVGVIMLAIFHNCKEYTNPNNGITVWNINCHHAFGTACFSTGPFIITCSDKVEEDTLKHESGHTFQSLILGPVYHFVVSIPSICLFWYRRITKKDMVFYYSHFPENWAEKLGKTDRYIAKLENQNGKIKVC